MWFARKPHSESRFNLLLLYRIVRTSSRSYIGSKSTYRMQAVDELIQLPNEARLQAKVAVLHKCPSTLLSHGFDAPLSLLLLTTAHRNLFQAYFLQR